MSATGFDISAALRAIGAAVVFDGDPLTSGALVAMPTQGQVVANFPMNVNPLRAEELTGDANHDAFYTPGENTVTVPVIYGGSDTLARFSPYGATGGGFSAPKRPTYTSLVIVPRIEMTTADPPVLTFVNGTTTWTPSAPVHAIWIWKAVPRFPDITFAWEQGGKVILPVTYDVFYDSTKPSGQRLWTQGNPYAKGVTTLAI